MISYSQTMAENQDQYPSKLKASMRKSRTTNSARWKVENVQARRTNQLRKSNTGGVDTVIVAKLREQMELRKKSVAKAIMQEDHKPPVSLDDNIRRKERKQHTTCHQMKETASVDMKQVTKEALARRANNKRRREQVKEDEEPKKKIQKMMQKAHRGFFLDKYLPSETSQRESLPSEPIRTEHRETNDQMKEYAPTKLLQLWEKHAWPAAKSPRYKESDLEMLTDEGLNTLFRLELKIKHPHVCCRSPCCVDGRYSEESMSHRENGASDMEAICREQHAYGNIYTSWHNK